VFDVDNVLSVVRLLLLRLLLLRLLLLFLRLLSVVAVLDESALVVTIPSAAVDLLLRLLLPVVRLGCCCCFCGCCL
jgi:hypothetical protein